MRNMFRLAAAMMMIAGSPALADESVRHPFHASVPRGAVRRVVIDIPAGEIELHNSDGATIAISGDVRRSFDGYRQRDRQQAMVDDSAAVITINGSEAVIERQYGPNAGSWTARSFHSAFHVRVDVPRGTDVEIGTHYGEVSIDGEFGDLDADLRAGEIHLRTPRSAVRDLNASVRLGEVHADFAGESVNNEGVFPGATHFHNTTGKSHINLHTTAGEVHVTLTR